MSEYGEEEDTEEYNEVLPTPLSFDVHSYENYRFASGSRDDQVDFDQDSQLEEDDHTAAAALGVSQQALHVVKNIAHCMCSCCGLLASDKANDGNAMTRQETLQRRGSAKRRTYQGFPTALLAPLSASAGSNGGGGRSSRSNSEASAFLTHSLLGTTTTNNTSAGGTTEVSRRIMVLGMRNSGKSSLVRRLALDSFEGEYSPTIETVVRTKIAMQGISFVCDIVDTAGQNEDISTSSAHELNLARQAMLGVHGYLLVFSLTSAQSLHQVQQIHATLTDLIGSAQGKCVLVGTKLDYVQRREVAREHAERLAAYWRIPYLECSSRTGVNTRQVFERLLMEMDRGELLSEPRSGGSFQDEDAEGEGGEETDAVVVTPDGGGAGKQCALM